MSWLKQSIVFGVFAFIIMVLFIVLSNPFNFVIDEVENESTGYLDSETVDDHISPFLNTLRTIFGLVFVLGFFSLIIGIFLVTHKDEYEEYPEEYRRY